MTLGKESVVWTEEIAGRVLRVKRQLSCEYLVCIICERQETGVLRVSCLYETGDVLRVSVHSPFNKQQHEAKTRYF